MSKNSSFDQATFAGAVDFGKAKLAEDTGFDNTAFLGVHRAGRLAGFFFIVLAGAAGLAVGATRWVSGWGDTLLWGVAGLLALATLVWSAIGGELLSSGNVKRAQLSFRNLKRICDNVKNKQGEALFHALELKATRLRGGRDIVSEIFSKPFERLFSLLYEIASDYALSIARPILWLVIFVPAFALLYWSWEGGGLPGQRSEFWVAEKHAILGDVADADPDYLQALTYSMGRLVPANPWNGGFESNSGECTVVQRLFVEGKDAAGKACRPRGLELKSAQALEAHRLMVRIVATLQSVMSLILLFLFALAVRRRFQIS